MEHANDHLDTVDSNSQKLANKQQLVWHQLKRDKFFEIFDFFFYVDVNIQSNIQARNILEKLISFCNLIIRLILIQMLSNLNNIWRNKFYI